MNIKERNLDGEIIERVYFEKLTEEEMRNKIREQQLQISNLDIDLSLTRMSLKPFINLANDYNLTLDQLYHILTETLENGR